MGKILPHPGNSTIIFGPGVGELEKKIICPGGRDSLRSKKFSRGGCTQLELTETLQTKRGEWNKFSFFKEQILKFHVKVIRKVHFFFKSLGS